MDEQSVSLVSTLVGQLGVVGVLVWYLWYKTTIADPKKEVEFRDQFKVISESHIKSTEKICDNFERCIREERIARKEDKAELKEIFSSLLERQRQ